MAGGHNPKFGWQATFLAILPAAIALWLIIARFVRIDSPTPTKIGIEVRHDDDDNNNMSKVSVQLI